MGMHRSTTPTTDSCSAPTSPASQNISPSNSPELPINHNLQQQQQPQTLHQQFANQQQQQAYSSYSNQQANSLQHQLEQFRMNNESENTNYLVNILKIRLENKCNRNFIWVDFL